VTRKEVEVFFKDAIVASVYADPENPGTTLSELQELAKHVDIGAGELSDYVRSYARNYSEGRYVPNLSFAETNFIQRIEPDYRNPEAFDFVLDQLKRIARDAGMAKATMQRDALVALAEAENLRGFDLKVAIVWLAAHSMVAIDGNEVRLTMTGSNYVGAVKQTNRHYSDNVRKRPYLDRCLHYLRELRAQADTGRPAAENVLELFDHKLDSIGQGDFRVWWAQVRRELVQADAHNAHLMVTVLSAVLVEGALSLVVKQAQADGRSMTKHLDTDLKKWRFEHLIQLAKSGQDAIFKQHVADRCTRLNEFRKRIHVGALLDGSTWAHRYDARADEATEAKETAKIAIRAILDWVKRGEAT